MNTPPTFDDWHRLTYGGKTFDETEYGINNNLKTTDSLLKQVRKTQEYARYLASLRPGLNTPA